MNIRTALVRIATGAVAIGGGYLLYRNISRFSYEELVASIYAIPWTHASAAILFMAASYLCLSGFDGGALRYLGKKLPVRKIILTSFVSLSIGHNVGVSFLSSGAVRYRYYSRAGLSAAEVGQLIVFCGTTVAIGLSTLAGLTLMLAAFQGKVFQFLEPSLMSVLAAAFLLFPAWYVVAVRFLPRRIHLYKWHLKVPEWKLAAWQVLVGTTNFACVSACLYFLLNGVVEVSFIDVALGYAMANMLAIISHVPGGLGVLEGGLLLILPGDIPFGVLIAFRMVYFFLPLVLGLSLFAATELFGIRSKRAGQENIDDTVTRKRRNQLESRGPSR